MLFRSFGDAVSLPSAGVGAASECGLCTPPEGYACGAHDCDDENPARTEQAGDRRFPDADGDGSGTPYGAVEPEACAGQSGWSSDANDCDDDAKDVFPGAADPSGDEIDGDCDGCDGPCTDTPEDLVRPEDFARIDRAFVGVGSAAVVVAAILFGAATWLAQRALRRAREVLDALPGPQLYRIPEIGRAHV